MGHNYTTTEGMVRVVLEKERPRWNALCNDAIIVANADGAITRVEIRDVIDRLADEYPRRIIYAPAVAAALQAARERHPYHNFEGYGSERIVLDQAEYCRFDITSAEDLGDTMEWLISQGNVQLSSQGREYQREKEQEKQTAEARLRLLSSILEGRKTTYPEWSPMHGKVVYIDAYTLENKSNEELAVIERETSDLRRRMGMTKDQQKETLHEFANTNRIGYDPNGNRIIGFENRPKTDSLDAPAVRPYSDQDGKSAIAGRVVTEGGAVGPVDPFLNSEGREFSKKEAYGLAKNDLATFRMLMKKDHARLNRILGN